MRLQAMPVSTDGLAPQGPVHIPVHIVSHKLELCAQAVPVCLDLVAPLVKAQLQRHLAGLERVHVCGVHCQHIAQPLHLQSQEP